MGVGRVWAESEKYVGAGQVQACSMWVWSGVWTPFLGPHRALITTDTRVCVGLTVGLNYGYDGYILNTSIMQITLGLQCSSV